MHLFNPSSPFGSQNPSFFIVGIPLCALQLCFSYLINHHNLHLVQLHCLLLQDLNESPRGGNDYLKRINRRTWCIKYKTKKNNVLTGGGGNDCKNRDCTLMLLFRRWSCGGSGIPPTSNAVLMLGRPITSSLACLSIWMASSLVGVRMRATGLPAPCVAF